LEQKENPDYDPNDFYANMHFGPREAILAKKGITHAADGSTQNLAEFYWYCRDTV
jgi:hypothetical protein